MRTFAGSLLLLSFGVVLWIASASAVELSARLGDQVQEKMNAIAKNGATSPVRPKRTPISEAEANSYLAFNLKDKMPKGLTDPRITALGNGALAGRVLLDIDDFKRNRRPGGIMDPFNYLAGKAPLTARGVLRTARGRGQFQLESAELNGIPLPKPLVQELVAFFTRTNETPKGVDLEAPFDLPARIREIVIQKSEAVVIQ
jgi:hypothetical protein